MNLENFSKIMFLLCLIQGIMEFLPVSSSLHLALMSSFMGLPSLTFALKSFFHLATFFPIFFFFWKDVKGMINDFFTLPSKARLCYFYIVAIIPAFIGALIWKDSVLSQKFTPFIVMGFGVILGITDLYGKTDCKDPYSVKNAWVIGLFQALAVVPAVSRLGICYSACRILSIPRKLSFKISMILALIPSCGGFILSYIKDSSQTASLCTLPMLGYLILTSIIGYISLFFMNRFVSKKGMSFFMYYRLGLGIFMLFFMYITGKTLW